MKLLFLASLIAVSATCTQGQATVQLTESDYAVAEANSALTVLATTQGIHSGNITLRITPLTFDMYRTQFPDQPCQKSVEALINGENEAETSDFNTNIIEKELGPNDLGETTTTAFNIPILSDNKLEGDEVFLVFLAVMPEDQVTVSRRCAVGILEGAIDASQEVIRLDPIVDQRQVHEHAGTFVLFNIIKIVDTELTIRITIEISNAQLGEDFTIIPGTTLEIPAENSSIPVRMQVVEDLLAEDPESLELRLRATVTGTPISQEFSTGITILDNEVISLGFVGEEERMVIEGSNVRVCADLNNITLMDYLRFDEQFTVSTIDGTARAGEDYIAVSSMYRPAVGQDCYNIQTMDNNRINDPKDFTFSFTSGLEDRLTTILPSSIRVVLLDNDAPPQAPSISSVSQNETLTVSWTADSTPTQPIIQFVGTITVDNQVIEFNATELTRIFTLLDFEIDKTHVIVICAENVNGRSCSSPFTVTPPPTTTETTTMETTTMDITPGGLGRDTGRISPGLIAAIAVVAAALLCCCLLLVFLLLCVCCWKVEREKSYFPGKAERREIRGKSPIDSSFSDKDFDEYSIDSDLAKAPL